MIRLGEILHPPPRRPDEDAGGRLRRLLPLLPLAAGFALLVVLLVQGARIVARVTYWNAESRRLAQALGAGGVPVPAGGPAGAPLAAPVPAESHPAYLVRHLEELLREAGISAYRYRVDPGGDGARPADGDAPLADRAFDLDAGRDDAGGFLEASPAGMEPSLELPAAEGLLEWRIAVGLRTPYERLARFLASLPASGRIWYLPRLELRKAGREVEAEMLLVTWTEAARDASPQHDPDIASRDPFVSRRETSGRARENPRPPALGAVMWGSQPAAWIEGRFVREGECAGAWRVLQISERDVVLAHEDGGRCRVDLLPDAGSGRR